MKSAGRRTSFAALNVGQADSPVPEPAPAPTATATVEHVVSGTVVPPSAGFPEEPEFTPSTAQDPTEQFVHYEGLISRARVKVERVLSEAERYWRLTAGPALKEIRDNGLYKTAGFSSFERYVADRWDMSRPRAYQLIDSVRAMKWLEGVTGEVPNERQLRAILPVGDAHGAAAAQQVWKLAEERGRTSGSALERAAADLGYRPAIEPPSDKQPLPMWARYEPVFGALEDLRGLRQVALEAPDRARQLAARFRQAAAELEADLSPADEQR
ncbi:hypothetical protein [Sphaerisporangium dianthi]|uniref:MarR family transcriptional regulator n=1 Tax=Sphaerisporangium dianthi TaxID=1436120 RepID=A0ABV9CWV4_9ACTN